MRPLSCSWGITALAVLAVAALSGPGLRAQDPRDPPLPNARAQQRPARAAQTDLTARGRVVQVQPAERQFTVRTADGKDVQFHIDRMTRVRVGDQEGGPSDLRRGADVSVSYDVDDGRNVANSVAVAAGRVVEKAAPSVRTVTARGRVVRVQHDPDVVFLDTADGELALPTTSRTVVRVGDKDIRLADLKAGTMVSVTYELRPVAMSITGFVGTAAPPAATSVRGEVLRVRAPENAFVVRTRDGREVSLYVAPQSRLRLNNRAFSLADLRVGTPLTVNYDVRGDRFVVTSVTGAPEATAVPASTTGTIQGVVLEGDRPQPNLEVSLRTDNGGREVQVQRTGPDGAFRFDKVLPGAYRVFSAKPISMTTGNVAVTAEAGKVKEANISLFRTPRP